MENSINSFIDANSIDLFGTKVFTPKHAGELVTLLIQHNYKILGIDGIFITQEGHRPSMEQSMLTYKMYENDVSKQEIQSQILAFIEGKENTKDLFFEVVFQS